MRLERKASPFIAWSVERQTGLQIWLFCSQILKFWIFQRTWLFFKSKKTAKIWTFSQQVKLDPGKTFID